MVVTANGEENRGFLLQNGKIVQRDNDYFKEFRQTTDEGKKPEGLLSNIVDGVSGDVAELGVCGGRGLYRRSWRMRSMGFRNRDLQAGLYAQAPDAQAEKRGRLSAVVRQLRAHGLIMQVPHAQRERNFIFFLIPTVNAELTGWNLDEFSFQGRREHVQRTD
jgi:hypothetical protein